MVTCNTGTMVKIDGKLVTHEEYETRLKAKEPAYLKAGPLALLPKCPSDEPDKGPVPTGDPKIDDIPQQDDFPEEDEIPEEDDGGFRMS